MLQDTQCYDTTKNIITVLICYNGTILPPIIVDLLVSLHFSTSSKTVCQINERKVHVLCMLNWSQFILGDTVYLSTKIMAQSGNRNTKVVFCV